MRGRCTDSSQLPASLEQEHSFPQTSSSSHHCGYPSTKSSHGWAPPLLLQVVILLISLIHATAMSTTATPKNIVVVGGGIQGTSVAYHMAKSLPNSNTNTKVTILEAIAPASAASGKGGGFMARSWGSGPTVALHQVAFDLYEQLAVDLECTSYRKLPVLSVTPGYTGLEALRKKDKTIAPLLPDWLDGKEIGRVSVMGYGDDTAQITPKEFVDKMLAASQDRVQVVRGTCVGVETDQGSQRGSRKVTAVQYQTESSESTDNGETKLLPADVVVVAAGPWSCAAEDWFHQAVSLPMEGIKSTSIVWKKPEGLDQVDATALFCGEDDRFGTHLEVYPRPDGTIYICGIGGSDYISTQDLQAGAFRSECLAKEDRVQAAKDSFSTMSSVYQSEGELEKVQACMRPCPPDAMPYMGAIPGYEGAYINAGHNCWGIAWAPACGKAMAELVLEGQANCVDLRAFDPSRFTLSKKGQRGRKRGTTNVGEQW